MKGSTPPTDNDNSFSGPTLYHAILYVPVDTWESYAYNNAWYRFINIRETATEDNELSVQQTYTLMNANTFTYSVYDPVNNQIATLNSANAIDENNPNHCWQVIKDADKTFLYNIGARKFAVAYDGGLFLADNAMPISISDGTDGITIGQQISEQWALLAMTV